MVTDPSKQASTVTTAANTVVDKPSSSLATVTTPKTHMRTTALNSPQPIVKLIKLSTPTTVITSCDIANNQEQIVEKAKQVIIKSIVTLAINSHRVFVIRRKHEIRTFNVNILS